MNKIVLGSIFIVIFSIMFLFALTNNTYADPAGATGVSSSTGIGCGGGFGPIADFLCNLTGEKEDQAEQAGNKLNDVISSVIGFLTVVASIWFIIQFLLAGFSWISAGGDKQAVETARNKMTYAILGLIVVVAAWILAGLMGKIFGLDILNPGAALQNLIL